MDPALSDEEIKRLLADRLDEIKLSLYEEVSEIREGIKSKQTDTE